MLQLLQTKHSHKQHRQSTRIADVGKHSGHQQTNTKLIRAAYLPQVAAVGGYFMSNPNVLNGFSNEILRIFSYRLWLECLFGHGLKEDTANATRAATSIAIMELNDARDKVELQVNREQLQS